MPDLGLVACGSVVDALRGRTEELRTLLADLDHDQLLIVSVSALAALGEALHNTPGGKTRAEEIALVLEHQNLEGV
ncbi:hypothetical protein AB0K87_14450 [Streptomyces sp. NPDC053705]|uniref:hypothetical protein n=1 Tax=Streptomyces sp. NPDC053705 TaxID=3156668 RepID=UPI003430D8FB